jgi:hypothetical protein
MDHTLLGVVMALIVIGLALLNRVSAVDSEEQQSGAEIEPRPVGDSASTFRQTTPTV